MPSSRYKQPVCTLGTLALAPMALASAPAMAVDLSIDHIEITQSIQDSSNLVPLVDGRSTTVRVFPDVVGLASVPGVTARLEVYSGATLLFDLLPDNGPITALATPDREVMDDTLNFTFYPERLLLGADRTLSFVVTIDPFSSVAETDETNNEHVEDATFECMRAPLIIGIPIKYAGVKPDPNLTMPGVGDNFVWGAYPFPDYEPGTNGRYRMANQPAIKFTLDINVDTVTLLNDIENTRVAMSPTPDYLYGWLDGNPFTGNGAAIGSPGQAAFGNTEDVRFQRTFAHEMGHCFGFSHDYDPITEVGWDVLDLLDNPLGLDELKESTLWEVMYAGLLTDQAWIDVESYEAVFNTIDNPCLVLTPLEWREFIFVPITTYSGQVQWKMGQAIGLKSYMKAIPRETSGAGYLRALDAGGRELYRTYIQPHYDTDSERVMTQGAAGVMIPANAAIKKLELYRGPTLQASITRTPNAPTVKITSPAAGATLTSGGTVQWTRSDLDGGILSATLQYSHDGGISWMTLGVRQTGTSLTLETDRLPSTTNGIIKISVTDGLNTTVSQVTGLRLNGNKAPDANILSPSAGDVYKLGSNVVLSVATSDAEEGAIQHDNITWSSNLQPGLGAGGVLNVDGLVAGQHTLTATVKDKAGAVTQRSVAITVR